jgi:cAMP phosphodiesterase
MEGWYPPSMADDDASDLTEFEAGLLEWLCENNFHVEPWSTQKAAKQFYVEEEAIYEAVAALTRKVPQRIQVFYKNGALHIAAD